MAKSYLAKLPIHFADFGFFVKVGDILVHDTVNANKLTVFRAGEIVKAVKQTPLAIAAMIKNEVITEIVPSFAKPVEAAKPPVKPIPEEVKPQPEKRELGKPTMKPAPFLEDSKKPKMKPKTDEDE